MDELHGRLVWTNFTVLSGVPKYCPFFGRFFVQTALLALDESLDEQEMGLSSCFPISGVAGYCVWKIRKFKNSKENKRK